MDKRKTRAGMKGGHGFTFLELLSVMAVIGILLAAGAGLMGRGAEKTRTAVATLSGMVDQGRALAITMRRTVVLALAAPDEVESGDGQCRVGLLVTDALKQDGSVCEAVMVGRWEVMPIGVVLSGGGVAEYRNPLDENPVALRYVVGGRPVEIRVHALAFTARGGLAWPCGSDPVILRVTEGRYRGGVATVRPSGGTVVEEKLRIGRVIARPWRIDG